MKPNSILIFFALFLLIAPLIYADENVNVAGQSNGGVATCWGSHASCSYANDENPDTFWDTQTQDANQEINITFAHVNSIMNFTFNFFEDASTTVVYNVSCFIGGEFTTFDTITTVGSNDWRVFYVNNTDGCLTDKVRLGVYTVTGDAPNMRMKEFEAYNTTQADTTAPMLNLDYPANFSFIDGVNYEFYINGTASDDILVVNVSQNNTLWGENTGTNESWSFLNITTIPEGNYTINITAFDLAGNQNSFFANFTVDYTAPTLTRNLPSSLTSGNQDGIYINVSAEDNYELYSYNLTCINETSDIVMDSIASSIGLPYYSSKAYLNWSNQSAQIFNCTTEVYDSHTALFLDDMKISRDISQIKLEYDAYKTNIGVKLKSSDIPLIDFGTSKMYDRYSFYHDFGSYDGYEHDYVFKISSNTDEVVYLPYSRYKGHFIIGHYWVTFDLNSKYPSVYNIKKTTQGYEIEIRTKETKLNFNSIGALNYASLNFSITKLGEEVYTLSLQAPPNNTAATNGSIDFIYYTNTTSANISLYINGTFNDSMISVKHYNSFHINFNENKTVLWSVNSTNSTVGTTAEWLLHIIYIYTPPSADVNQPMSFNACYFSEGNYGAIFGILFLFLLSAGVLSAGYIMKNAITGFIGGFILLIASIYLYYCFITIAVSVSLLAVWLCWYFLSNGWRGIL